MIAAGVNVALTSYAAERSTRKYTEPAEQHGGSARSLYTGFPLRIRTTVLPHVRDQVEGFDLRRFEPGQIYEVSARLGEFMIVMGYAEVEMRRFERESAADGPRRRRGDPKP